MKIKKFNSFAEYEAYMNICRAADIDPYENTAFAVRHGDHVDYDMETTCKYAKTAYKRFAKLFNIDFALSAIADDEVDIHSGLYPEVDDISVDNVDGDDRWYICGRIYN